MDSKLQQEREVNGGTPFAEARGSVTEIVYTWPDGREEVRYRRTKNSPEALALIEEVLTLQAKHGSACPYSYRDESPNEKLTDHRRE